MRYLLAIVTTLAALTSVSASADEPPIRVAVSPFVYVSSASGAVASDGRDSVVQGMQSWVANAGAEFELASVSALRRSVVAQPHYIDASNLGRLHMAQGIRSYRELDPLNAASSLTQAQEQFYRADHQFVVPEEVSEALLFRALALLDSGSADPNEPLNAMKEMVLIDPTRTVQQGSFPEEVVSFFQSARLDFERDVREGGPGERFPKRIAALTAHRDQNAVATPTDYVLVGNVLKGATGAELVVWLYDVETEQFQRRASVEVTSPSADRLADAANRLTSQLLTCLVEPAEQDAAPLPKSSGASPFALQLNLAYASYYRFPAVDGQPVEPFDHLGAAIGGALYLTREFAVVTMFQFLTSTSEFSGLVAPGFTTLRAFGGGELGMGFGRLRVALGTLLEATAVSKITTCPGREVEDRLTCRDPVELPSRFLFGVNARPRVSYRVLDSMQLFVGGSSSFYFLPLGSRALNFLTAVEAGLQYRF